MSIFMPQTRNRKNALWYESVRGESKLARRIRRSRRPCYRKTLDKFFREKREDKTK